MKAVLIINIPEDFDYKKCNFGGDGNIYYIRDGEKASIVGNIKNIKPLPQKKVPYFDPNSSTYDEEREIAIMHEIDGYNRCIDEVTGEVK